ncbi:MAG: OmpA family protein [Eubacteriales bacterium]|nr:OmpA family protein [Eubacteriales bacterium]
MRSNRRTLARRYGRNDGSFWLSFSDLMSSLVLIIILVMFYIIYQYFNLAEINQAEIARRQYQLDEAQAELETQQGKLTEAEKQMIAQQILLDAKQEELDSAQAVLEAQKTELADTQAQLSEKEAEIAAQQAQMEALGIQLDEQQAQINTQQAQLDNQQAQIEQLVGMKTRIITSLSSALKSSSISATVDPTTGSIALESDVLFESGEYKLTDAGKRFVDKFLPVYLDVLFSEEYKGYVSEIIIEGHTDSVGGYLTNLELSQQRALAVASYVLGDSCRAISADVKNTLRPVVTVNGRSYSDRIFNADGTENMDASRRVVFKFRLTDEQMIQQLRQILESE